MKKLNYLMLGLAGLMMASCSQDDLQAPGQADGNYIVTVKLPSNLGTRAINMNTGYTANDLYYAVYDAEDNSLVQWNQTKFTEAAGGALETQVGLNLATGKSYKISFFACAPDNKVYTFDANAKTMTVNYAEMTSEGTEENDIYDCFINLLETKEIGSAQMQSSVTLYRPIAQINWGTSDLDEPSIQKAYGVDGEYILSNLSTDAYYTWNLLDNDVDMSAGKKEVKFKDDFFTQPKSATGLAGFPVTGYKYVAMQYVLAPKTEAIYDLNLNITNEGDGNPDPSKLTSDVQVSSAPVQANYQTNIYGSLLTDNVIVNVVKSPAWMTPSKDFELIDGQKYAVITAANASAVKNGGNMILGSDIVYPGANTYIPLTKSSNINLNGFSLTSQGYKPADKTQTGDAIVVGNGATVKISNGTLLPATLNALPDGSSATINLMTNAGGSLTLDNVDVVGDMYPVMMTSASATANITINSGNFTFTDNWTSSDIVDKQVCVYIAGAGTATINGGTFGMPGVHSEYLLNVKDDKRAGRQPNEIITVKGGTFINFDPSNNTAEGPNTNFVADGYKVVSSTVGSDVYYTVVPGSTASASTASEVNEAAKNGGNVIITSDITPTAQSFDQGVYNGYTSISQNGGTINGNGNTLNVGSYYANGKESYGIYTSGGTIQNLTIKNAFRAILVASPMKEDLLIEGCNLSGAYALNTTGSSSPYTLTVNNTVITGWSSWNALSSASFTNCSFNIGSAFNDAYFNKVFRAYVETTFSNCTFQEGMIAGLSELPEGVKVIFHRCKVGNTYLTAANAASLFGEIELPEGKTLNDVAIFN